MLDCSNIIFSTRTGGGLGGRPEITCGDLWFLVSYYYQNLALSGQLSNSLVPGAWVPGATLFRLASIKCGRIVVLAGNKPSQFPESLRLRNLLRMRIFFDTCKLDYTASLMGNPEV